MGILIQIAPNIGDLFKLTVMTVMAVTIGLMVVSMASSYVLATSKSGTLLLRRDQGEMAVFWDSRSRRL
ncbi:MAG: hypothetical protein BZY86_01330 [SAR202 cluster bacterium MP-NPac-SRR3961935-G1]|jgi:hypothetical protein|nr:MAG: hypothetical protein BZY86_01330 [SAR202 cluster bacterium MP-NPac-SRR3961935-G1]